MTVGATILILIMALSTLELTASTARDSIDSPEVISVKGEELKLSAEKPDSWMTGTPLQQLWIEKSGTPVPGAVIPETVVVRFNGRVLKEGVDYILEREWGSLGIGPDATVTINDAVTVDYNYSLLRIDSRVRTYDGKEIIRRGKSHLTIPLPPEINEQEKRLSNIFIDYQTRFQSPEELPILETANQAITSTTVRRIPKTLSKIKSGQPVKIVCWGDSVTDGGDASSIEMSYPRLFEKRLKEKFFHSNIKVEIVAVGGSTIINWLYPERFPGSNLPGPCDWQKIVDAKPDLITLEFVNDCHISFEQVEGAYRDLFVRLNTLGTEIILITPHFTMRSWMGKNFNMRGVDSRPYVLTLREFAKKHCLALADASSRWGHLWKEGIPYVTYLHNGINHPDDRGHKLFVEELIKCFDD